jgi:hypothetical protein
MTKSDNSEQYWLMCLRLAAECNNLAGDPAIPNHRRATYLRTADMWMELAVSQAQGDGDANETSEAGSRD